ncbi:MAG: LacI family DNA-binding transcriptional regulator [Anaerolinea sp.]|nr:LacI family DNA-binding transcriptional regulator [Anaerolinea sp.]
MATIKEVAEYARVSVATVSRVVNNTGYVSTDLRERVEQAMSSLNYKPSALARSLRRQETLTVGVLLPQLNQPFFSTLAFAMEKTLFASSYKTIICSSEEDVAKEAAYIDMLLRQRVDGVLIVPTGQSVENVNRLITGHVPAVLIDRDLPNMTINRVLTNNSDGACQAMRHLLELGHRRIAVIGGPPYSRAIEQRLHGIKRAFAELELPYDNRSTIMSTLTEFEMGYQIAHQLLGEAERPTAIFALTDVIAVGVLHAAADHQLSLPRDLSVVGFDDIPLARFSIPSLTTVAQPIYEMGETAAALLLDQLRTGSPGSQTTTLETRLEIRQSTAPPLG